MNSSLALSRRGRDNSGASEPQVGVLTPEKGDAGASLGACPLWSAQRCGVSEKVANTLSYTIFLRGAKEDANMTILEIVQIILAVSTIATGLVSLIRPKSVKGFTGLSAPGPRGITEIRAVLGGAFIGLGLAPLVLSAPAAYKMLGITYLVIFVSRAAGMALDKSFERSNWISLAFEIVAGVVLLL